jgi:uncharacterized membrane protein YbhN (UPF0104 family)
VFAREGNGEQAARRLASSRIAGETPGAQPERFRQVPPALRWLLRLLASGVLIGAVFTVVPVVEVAGGVLRASLVWVAAALALRLLARACAATRTHLVTRAYGLDLSRWQVFEVVLITNFYSLFLPGQVAGGIVPVARYHALGARLGPTLACLVFSRLAEVLAFVALGLAFFVLEIWLGLDTRSGWTAAALGTALGSLFALLLLARQAARLVGRLVPSRFHFRAGAGAGTQARSPEDVAPLRTLHAGTIVLVATLSAVQVLIVALSGYAFAGALALDLSYASVWQRCSALRCSRRPRS